MGDIVERLFPSLPPDQNSADYVEWVQVQTRLLEMALDGIVDAVVATMPDGRITYVNTSACKLFGGERELLMHQSALSFFCNEKGQAAQNELLRLVARDLILRRVRTWIRASSGEIIPVELSVARLVIGNRKVRFVGTLRDRREDLANEQELLRLAQTDSLTGCVNRRWFDEELRRILQTVVGTTTWVGAVFIDLDNFKRINDELSYDNGDRVLVSTVQSILSVLRDSDRVVRLGGDEFVLLFEGVAPADVVALANRIVQSVREMQSAALPSDCRIRVTASVGVSVIRGDDPRVTRIFRIAEQAKRVAKDAGKDRVAILPEDIVVIPRLQ